MEALYFLIPVVVVCVVFIYVAFQHVSSHEKFDSYQAKKLMKKQKSKNK
jgi:nitrogen fixation-related uncharacterized protein